MQTTKNMLKFMKSSTSWTIQFYEFDEDNSELASALDRNLFVEFRNIVISSLNLNYTSNFNRPTKICKQHWPYQNTTFDKTDASVIGFLVRVLCPLLRFMFNRMKLCEYITYYLWVFQKKMKRLGSFTRRRDDFFVYIYTLKQKNSRCLKSSSVFA